MTNGLRTGTYRLRTVLVGVGVPRSPVTFTETPAHNINRTYLDAGLQEQVGCEFWIEVRGHRLHGQVFGADAAVLARHVRMQRVSGLGHRAAQHAPVPGANGVLVLQMGAQSVGRTVNLAALGARSRVGRPHSVHLDRSPR